MRSQEYRKELAINWLEKAKRSLNVAFLDTGEAEFAVPRLYYAAFYGMTAVMVADEKPSSTFTSHKSVRATLHRDYVRTGLIPQEMGRLYDHLLNDRFASDYTISTDFTIDGVKDALAGAEKFVAWTSEYITKPTQ